LQQFANAAQAVVVGSVLRGLIWLPVFPGDDALHSARGVGEAFADFEQRPTLQFLQLCRGDAGFARLGYGDGIFFGGELRQPDGFLRGDSRHGLRGVFVALPVGDSFASRGGQRDFAHGFHVDERGEHAAEDFADGCEIVAGDPAREDDQVRRERGNIVEKLSDIANFYLGVYALGQGIREFDHHADEGFIAEGHEDAGSRLHGIAQSIRNGVGEQGTQRNGQRHVTIAGNHASGLTGG
jgi:hypothetical protein